jgi:hypothetical protein
MLASSFFNCPAGKSWLFENLKWVVKGGCSFYRLHELQTHEFEQRGEGEWVYFDMVCIIFPEEFVHAPLLLVRLEVRVLKHQNSLKSIIDNILPEQIVDFVEERLNSRIAQCEVDPFHCPQAEDGVVLSGGVKVEEVVVEEAEVARKFLLDGKVLGDDLEESVELEGMSLLYLPRSLLEE